MKKTIIAIVLVCSTFCSFSQTDSTKKSNLPLTYWMNADELARKNEIGMNFRGTNPPEAPIINIAEFQPMQGVLVRYPFGIPVSLIAAMSQIVTVTTSISSANQQTTVENIYRSNGVNMNNVDFVIANTDSYWTRDYGPWIIIDGNDEFGVVDFIYNRPRPNDDAHAASMANFLNINYFSMDFVQTGGNYMTDGYGTAASTDLALTENEDMTTAEIENMTHDFLGIDTYHFTADPLDDYIAHIDCWGKYLAVDKVMIGQVPASDYRYSQFEAIADWFANTTTPWGNKYRVYRVFTPGGMNTTTPYTNCLILNDHVFLPQTGSSYDQDAIEAYQAAMPGYTIVPIMESSSTPWENTDALHCRTHEIADLGMLLIRHYPICGQQAYYPQFTIQADITALSGQALESDSILIYYKINQENWQNRPMHAVGGKTWEGTISGITDSCGISYYIFAKDYSLRREKHPYIGEYDPHFFTVSAPYTPPIIIDDDYEEDDIYTQITDSQINNYKITPNPAHSFFHIYAANGESVSIYDASGKLISQNSFHSQKNMTVDCSQWADGIYFILIKTKNGKTITDKILITSSL